MKLMKQTFFFIALVLRFWKSAICGYQRQKVLRHNNNKETSVAENTNGYDGVCDLSERHSSRNLCDNTATSDRNIPPLALHVRRLRPFRNVPSSLRMRSRREGSSFIRRAPVTTARQPQAQNTVLHMQRYRRISIDAVSHCTDTSHFQSNRALRVFGTLPRIFATVRTKECCKNTPCETLRQRIRIFLYGDIASALPFSAFFVNPQQHRRSA